MKNTTITAALTYSASYDSDRNEAPFEVQTEIIFEAQVRYGSEYFGDEVHDHIESVTIDRACIKFQAYDNNGNKFPAQWNDMPTSEPECSQALYDQMYDKAISVFHGYDSAAVWPVFEPKFEPFKL